MSTVKGLQFYDFSRQNKYSSDYYTAYQRALQAKNEVIKCENSPYSSVAEIKKWEEELKRWSKKTENISFRAKNEEMNLEKNSENGLGQKLNFLA